MKIPRSLPQPRSQCQITVEPGVFVPNNDGIKDFTTINYQFDKGGYLLKIVIYDVKGRRIKEVVNNHLSGVSGFYQWNGTDDRNLLVQSGLLYCVG